MMQQPVADIGIPVYKKFLSKHPIVVRTGIRYQGLLLSNEENISSTNFHSITVPLLVNYSLSRATTISFIGLASSKDKRQRMLFVKRKDHFSDYYKSYSITG